MSAHVLETLFETIQSRLAEKPEGSYTVDLVKSGKARVAQKVGEEAVETVLAAMTDDKLAEESADLLYHLLVLWAACDIRPEQVWAVLQKRVK